MGSNPTSPMLLTKLSPIISMLPSPMEFTPVSLVTSTSPSTMSVILSFTSSQSRLRPVPSQHPPQPQIALHTQVSLLMLHSSPYSAATSSLMEFSPTILSSQMSSPGLVDSLLLPSDSLQPSLLVTAPVAFIPPSSVTYSLQSIILQSPSVSSHLSPI